MNGIKRTKFYISLLGGSYDGKTCIIKILLGKKFDPSTISNIGIDSIKISEEIDGNIINFKIFDTAGQERYRKISSSTINLSDGILIIFDVGNKISLNNSKYWLKDIKENFFSEDKVIYLVGNKIDLEKREISREDALIIAKENNLKYFETSAKTGYGIKEVFKEIFIDIYTKYKEKLYLMDNSKPKEIMEKKKLKEQKEKEKREKKIIEKERLKNQKEKRKMEEIEEKRKKEKEQMEKDKKKEIKYEKKKKEMKLNHKNYLENDRILLNNLKKYISY